MLKFSNINLSWIFENHVALSKRLGVCFALVFCRSFFFFASVFSLVLAPFPFSLSFL